MYPEFIDNQNQKATVPQQETSRANFILAIAVDIVFLYIVNNLISSVSHPLDQFASKDYPGIIVTIINWVANFQAPFLNHSFISCLWAINLALGLGIMGNFVFLLYRPQWFQHLIQAVICGAGFLAAYLVLKTFPFEISSTVWQIAIRTLLLLIMFGTAIGLIVELIRFIRSPISIRVKPDPPSPPPPPIPPENGDSGQV